VPDIPVNDAPLPANKLAVTVPEAVRPTAVADPDNDNPVKLGESPVPTPK